MRQVIAFNNKNVILPEPFDDKLRLISLENGSVFKMGGIKQSQHSSLLYSLDGKIWENITLLTNIVLNVNEKIYIRRKVISSISEYENNPTYFNLNIGKFKILGNIMYFYDYENLNNGIYYNCAFLGLFKNCTSLVDASELMMPRVISTSVNNGWYSFYNMFRGCSLMTTAPELPATTLAGNCYNSMFYNCSGLTSAPELPATTLAIGCYSDMFLGCTSLTLAPSSLPASAGDNYNTQNCYNSMFSGCTSLTETPVIYLINAPGSGAMQRMFYGCTSLNKVTTYLQSYGYGRLDYWLRNVSPTGDFYNLGGANYQSGPNGIPTGWAVHTSL